MVYSVRPKRIGYLFMQCSFPSIPEYWTEQAYKVTSVWPKWTIFATTGSNLELYQIIPNLYDLCFVHPIFGFLVLVTLGDEVMKILGNLCLHLQGKMGKTKKTDRKSRNKSDKNTKNLKTKIWDERNYGYILTRFSRNLNILHLVKNLYYYKDT